MSRTLIQTKQPYKILFWVVGGGICCIFVWGAVGLFRPSEPFVDLSKRIPSGMQPAVSADSDKKLRFAVATMVSAEPTFSIYRRLVKKICSDVGRKDTFVLSSSYADVRKALERGDVDVALVCTGTYIHGLKRGRIKLLVQPEFEDGLQYKSVFIVSTKSPAKNIEDLRGMDIAFTDPESNTGCLVPRAVLAKRGLDPETFFNKVVFTGSHDRSIRAVVIGTVDAAAIDYLVLTSARKHNSSLAKQIRIIWESEQFGPPPIVVPKGLDSNLENLLRESFLALDKHEEGRQILSEIGIKRFVMPREEDYQSVRKLYANMKDIENQ